MTESPAHDMNVEITPSAQQRPPVIEIPPVHLAVSGIYADGNLNIVQGQLRDELTVQLPEGVSAAHLSTDGVVMVAAEDVVMIAFSVRPERMSTIPAAPRADGLELIGRAEDALQLATQAMHRIADSHPA